MDQKEKLELVIQTRVKLLRYLLEIASEEDTRKHPGSCMWRALLAEMLENAERGPVQ